MRQELNRKILADKLKGSNRLQLMIDFDGTLAPLSSKPNTAKLPQANRHLVQLLAEHPDIEVAIISGRSMEDLRRLCPLEGVIYAADHGIRMQLFNQRCIWFGNIWKIQETVTNIYKRLRAEVKHLGDGVLVENKPYSVAMHYRMASRAAATEAKELFRKLAPPLNPENDFHFITGSEVLEFRPKDLHKGIPVRYLIDVARARDALPIFIGDDTTDEDGFEAIQHQGMGIKVGHSQTTHATYWIKDQTEVKQLLEWLQTIVTVK